MRCSCSSRGRLPWPGEVVKTGAGSALIAFMVKEVRHILRDRQTLLILLLLPLAMVVIFGFALRSEVRTVRVVFVDPAPDFATAALKSRFAGNGRFEVVGSVPRIEDTQPLFRRGAADILVAFEPGFARALGDGSPARILVIGDASDPNTGSMMQTYTNAVIAAYQAELQRETRRVTIDVSTRMRYNPLLKSVNLFVPGLIALVLTLITALMTAISLSREKERGTLEVLLVSPLRPWQIIVG
ncbi:MAG TPA: ABC transporter permease, partial [Gemmatimonadaceae bacterium]|nr:ABC transporter permease [Gemmatimonadaceae bacterium]